MLFRVLQITTTAYYQFARGRTSAPQAKQVQIFGAIKAIRLEKHHEAYGSPRMHRELIKHGIQCCRNTVAKYMRKAGISANRRAKFRITTTDSNHDHPIAPIFLNQNFSTQAINEVWLTDITYIPTQEGFTYLAAIDPLSTFRGQFQTF